MLPDHCHRQVPIGGAADVLAACALAAELAAGAALSETQRERFSLIVTELATNVLRHAPGHGGSLLLRWLGARTGLECICTDRGGGIADLGAALRDGGSTGQGLGLGLGAVQRLADDFALHTEPAAGTAILARVGDPGREAGATFHCGAVMLPMAGQGHCGDGWVLSRYGLVAVIDGLGHGLEASLAARRAEASVDAVSDPHRAIEVMHEALRGTRGAVVMAVQPGSDGVQFAGVGNVSATLLGMDRQTSLHSAWGVVGSGAPIPGVHHAAWSPGDVLLLHSDGLSGATAAFQSRHLRYVAPALAAAVVLRDATTKLDDQTVVVLQCPRVRT